jgi:hypothetical protein
MIIHNVKQGSEEWHRLRLGIPTASEFHKIITPKKLELSSQAPAYMNRLLAEWIYGNQVDTFETPWMEYGNQMELEAVKAYEFEREITTQACGFISSDSGLYGASPDRLITEHRGILEIKCKSASVHVGHMICRDLYIEHMIQVQGQLWIAEAEWADIMCYSPHFPSVITRVKRDDYIIKAISEAVSRFVEILLETRKRLRAEYPNMKVALDGN